MRSRSFFLEFAMEHYIDELLSACGMSRANLLYSGGHCYLLLPNTPGVIQTLESWNTRFNDWLLESFGTTLFLAQGYTPCTAGDLTLLAKAMKLLQMDYLGGHGSRGSGRVSRSNFQVSAYYGSQAAAVTRQVLDRRFPKALRETPGIRPRTWKGTLWQGKCYPWGCVR